jgi:hypothetical protein
MPCSPSLTHGTRAFRSSAEIYPEYWKGHPTIFPKRNVFRNVWSAFHQEQSVLMRDKYAFFRKNLYCRFENEKTVAKLP